MWSEVIGERSEPPSDNLGGEFLFPRACLYVCHYYGVVRPDNQYHAHSLCCMRTFTLIKGWFLCVSPRPEIIIFPTHRDAWSAQFLVVF